MQAYASSLTESADQILTLDRGCVKWLSNASGEGPDGLLTDFRKIFEAEIHPHDPA